MKKRFAFFYFFEKETTDRVKDTADQHVRYWKKLDPEFYMGGPFTDRSGGMIIFSSDDLLTASETAMNDPFTVEGLHENRWIKEWFIK